MNSQQMKDTVCDLLNTAYGLGKFNTFAKAFRLHVDPLFSSEHSLAAGRASNHNFADWASYFIGDGDYDLDEAQFESFVKDRSIERLAAKAAKRG